MDSEPPDLDERTFTAAGMEVSVDPVRQILSVRTLDGVTLANLRLLASVDAVEGLDEVMVTDVQVGHDDAGELRVSVHADSSHWQRHSTVLHAAADALEISTTVQGVGRVSTIRQLGARTPGQGLLPSDLRHRTVFSPNPDQPWRVLRRSEESAALGVVGDGGQPGMGRWLFTPPPLCFGMSPDETVPGSSPSGPWLMVGVAAAKRPFSQITYEALTPGFSLRYDYDGHTSVAGEFTTPTLLVFLASDPYEGLARYRELLEARGLLPLRETPAPSRAWLEPMFCGWGAQNADAVGAGVPMQAAAYSRQEDYDRYLRDLERYGIRPGTIVIDDKWQHEYATCQPDLAKWPDLAAWIAARHDDSQRVLLWYKAWDAEGAPPEACVRDRTGRAVALDPESPAGRRLLRRAARTMILDLDADGIKIDFTASTPAGNSLDHAGSAWGIDLLHELLDVLYKAIKEIKPEALVVTHTPDPAFRDVTDMLRLNDVMLLDQPGGAAEPATSAPGSAVVAAMTHRALVARAVCPDLLIDTDGWILPSLAAYRSWTEAQGSLGVPSLYYVDRLDAADPRERSIPTELLLATANHWAAYRRALPQPSQGSRAIRLRVAPSAHH